MKTFALILTLLLCAQPAIYAASSCAPAASTTMSCCKGKVCCCCKHHDQGSANHHAGKSEKRAPLNGCSIGCSNSAATFIAPAEKSITSVLEYVPIRLSTEFFGHLPDSAATNAHTTSPPAVSCTAIPLPLRI